MMTYLVFAIISGALLGFVSFLKKFNGENYNSNNANTCSEEDYLIAESVSR